MKRIALIAAAATLAATGANAADLYHGGSMKDAPLAAPIAWTGFYVGGNAGGAWSTYDSSFSYADAQNNWSVDINHTNAAMGFIGGGQVGYNFMTSGGFVLGIEADFGYLGVDQTRNIVEASWGTNSAELGTKIEGGFIADVTGRLGYAAGPALFYVKGGWAYLDATAGTNGIDALATTMKATGFQDVNTSGFDGWTFGGGIEYHTGPSWSVKLEYQHFDFGSFVHNPVPADAKIAIDNDLTVDVVKVGLNYHFNAR